MGHLLLGRRPIFVGNSAVYTRGGFFTRRVTLLTLGREKISSRKEITCIL